MNKIDREKVVVAQMIKLYCKHKEGNKDLCPKCATLMQYALQRLDHCKFGNNKTSCKKCPIHCYNPQMRKEIKKVMKWAGMRMLLYHPITTILHML